MAVRRIEEQFRVEVWDAGETTLLETVSRASDFPVSLAAWQAALRRRPGMLLIHKNGDHVMERMVAPGEAEPMQTTVIEGVPHEGFDAALRDLRHWHSLRAMCRDCSHHAPVDREKLLKRFGADVFFSTIEQKLKCSKCRRSNVRLEIQRQPRD
jgi:hypothetical protein